MDFLLQSLGERKAKMERRDIKSMTLKEIQEDFLQVGEKSFRAKQVFSWLHQKQAESFEEMSNLSKEFRKRLQDTYFISSVKELQRLESSDGTKKFLFSVDEENVIESVLMEYSYGFAACISTQVGCRMGCSFCASTLGGLVKNLTAGQMLSQVYTMQKVCGGRIGSIVLMGSGEPLDNYESVLRFIRLINHPDGLNLGQRHITVSTCGLTDRIYDLAKEELQITLAVSLHAPNDKIRNHMMPISKRYPMDQLLEACQFYSMKTKRRVTFEYALSNGVNDSDENAKELAGKLKNMLSHVNLIPINNVEEREYLRSSQERIRSFSEILKNRGIETTVRRELGSDINAACGQLRRSYLKI